MSEPTAYETPDFTAAATVRSVLAQVHRRTARFAALRGVAAAATAPEDEDALRSFVRDATRRVAVRTGRVVREGQAAWTDNAGAGVAVLPAWAAGARLSSATWTPEGSTTAETLNVVHGSVQALVRPGDGPRTLYVGAGGAMLLMPDPGLDGVITFAAASRFGLDEAADLDADAFAVDAVPGGAARLVFPPELQGAVVRYVLKLWFEEVDLAESDRHGAEFEADLATFGSDDRREGFARTGHAAPGAVGRRGGRSSRR